MSWLSKYATDTSSELFPFALSLYLSHSNHLLGKLLYPYWLSKSRETQQGEGRLFMAKKASDHRDMTEPRWCLGLNTAVPRSARWNMGRVGVLQDCSLSSESWWDLLLCHGKAHRSCWALWFIAGVFPAWSKGTNGMKSQCAFLWSTLCVAQVQADRAGNCS